MWSRLGYLFYAWRFLEDQKINREYSLRISTDDFPITLGKGLYFYFQACTLGLFKKREMEDTKSGVKGQGFNTCKCFYISWYKTHDCEWLPKCLNPVRHTKNEWSEHHLFVLLVHVVMVTYLTTCGYGNAFEIMKDPLLYYNDNYQWHL